MDRPVLVGNIVLGLTMTVVYLVQCYRHRKPVDVGAVPTLFLGAGGIVGGVLLLGSSLFPELKKFVGQLDLYVAIAGVSVFLVSWKALWRELVRRPAQPAPSNRSDSIAFE